MSPKQLTLYAPSHTPPAAIVIEHHAYLTDFPRVQRAAREFANWCYENASSAYMDAFTAQYQTRIATAQDEFGKMFHDELMQQENPNGQ